MKQEAWKRQTGSDFSRTVTLCLLLVVLLPFTSCNHDATPYKDGDVVLGGLFFPNFAGEREHCGDLFTMDLGNVEAMIFAIESVNNNPNLLPNVTLGYDIRNYCESSALAMQITYDLVRGTDPICTSSAKDNSSAMSKISKVGSKPISALVGPTSSNSAILVGSLLQVANIPAISPSATSADLSSKLYKDFFRTIPSDNWQAKVMADIIELFNWTYVAAVGLDDSYGRNGIWALEKESYQRKTFCIAFSEFIPRLGYQEKVKRTVSRMKLSPSVGVVIVWLSGSYGRAFFKEATDQNLQGKTFILSDALTAEEAVFLGLHFTILDGSLGMRPRDYPDPAFEEHLKQITPAKSIQNGVMWWEEFWRSQFNCSATKSNDSGVEACTANLTSYQAVTKIRNSYASYLIDAVYALAHALDGIYSCSTPHGAPAKDSCPSVQPTVKGSDLQKYLRNVSFEGLTGKVSFDSSGDPISVSYDIVNFQRESSTDRGHRKRLVGVWDKYTTPNLKINASILQWSSFLNNMSVPVSFCASDCLPGSMKTPTTPCCWDCIKCPHGTISTDIGSSTCKECEPETRPNEGRTNCEPLKIINIALKTTIGISITVVAFIGLVLTLLVCASYIKFYNTPIVKASTREVSFLLLFGIAALFALTVLELAEPSDFLCSAQSFCRYFAQTLCITVLFVKTMRIASVFQVDKPAQLFSPCYKTVTRQTVLISVLNVAALSLIVLWMSIDPPGREKIIRSDEYIFLVCKPFNTKSGFSLLISVCVYTLIVALLCTYYAFKARGIPENFNEAKYIAFSMYILLLSWLAYYPVVFNFESWYVILVSCSTTLVTSFGLLSCMFGPKIYIILFRPAQNTVESVRAQVSQYSFQVSRTNVWPATTATSNTNTALELSKPELGTIATTS